MTGKTHQLIGITAGLTVYLATAPAAYNPATFAAVLVVTSLGSLLPDIDQSGSQFWRSIPLGRFWGEVMDPLLEHRNFTHSLAGFALITLGVRWLLMQAPDYWGMNTAAVLLAFVISYASHLVADMVTVGGIPLLFPYQRTFGLPPRPFEGLRIQTGEWFENLLIFPAVNLLLVYVVWVFWPQIRILLFQ